MPKTVSFKTPHGAELVLTLVTERENIADPNFMLPEWAVDLTCNGKPVYGFERVIDAAAGDSIKFQAGSRCEGKKTVMQYDFVQIPADATAAIDALYAEYFAGIDARLNSLTAYAHPSLPCHWIVDASGDLYLVPNIPQGWSKRTPLVDGALVKTADKVKAGQLCGLVCVLVRGLGVPATPFARWLAEMGELRSYKRAMDKKEAAELIGISQDSVTKYAKAERLPLTVAMAMAAAKAGLTRFK